MELILVVVISAGMAGNSQNGVSRSLKLHHCKKEEIKEIGLLSNQSLTIES